MLQWVSQLLRSLRKVLTNFKTRTGIMKAWEIKKFMTQLSNISINR